MKSVDIFAFLIKIAKNGIDNNLICTKGKIELWQRIYQFRLTSAP